MDSSAIARLTKLQEEMQSRVSEMQIAYEAQITQLNQENMNLNKQMQALGFPQSAPGGLAQASSIGPWQNPNQPAANDPFVTEMEQKKSRMHVQPLDILRASPVINNVLKTDIVPFLWGPPGIGKSTLVKKIAKDNGWELIDLRLSLLNPVDLRGLPVVDKENQQADWYPPAFLPKYDTDTVGILFLDEINLAPLSVQAAAYQLILDKQVGDYRFPKKWKIIAAGNRETDRANVYKLSAPLANRFVHFDIQPRMDTWATWAREAGIRVEILDFLALRPSLLMQMPNDSQKAFPSPRSWDFCSQLMQAFNYQPGETPDENLKNAIIGTIGEAVGKEFVVFLQDWDQQAVSKLVEEFITTGRPPKMPKPTSLRYAFIMAVVDAHLSDKIDPTAYKKFFNSLSGEEQKAVEVFEEEKGEEIRKLRKARQMTAPNMSKPTVQLMRPVYNTDTTFYVNQTAIFNNSGKAILFDNQGRMEVISFTHKDAIVLYGVQRAQDGTRAEDWGAGAYIQPV